MYSPFEIKKFIDFLLLRVNILFGKVKTFRKVESYGTYASALAAATGSQYKSITILSDADSTKNGDYIYNGVSGILIPTTGQTALPIAQKARIVLDPVTTYSTALTFATGAQKFSISVTADPTPSNNGVWDYNGSVGVLTKSVGQQALDLINQYLSVNNIV